MYEVNEEIENQTITKLYKEVLRESYQTLSTEDKKLVRKAFDFSLEAHSDQRRKSGEPYIYHPLEVARIVAGEIGLGATSIAAALMHDVVEDTSYTLEDIKNLFNQKIATIIDGLTKISNIKKKEVSIQSENYKKLLLTLSEDVRVILIKIADRLHNMRTLEFMPEDKQLKIASETLFIYVPLAHRMGLYNIKAELEDLCLMYRRPIKYQEIKGKLAQTKVATDAYMEQFIKSIDGKIEQANISVKIKGRIKSISSIRKKMKEQDVAFEEVYDKFAIRIVYDSTKEEEKFTAWKIYSIVTDLYKPNPQRLRDWISQPRSTGYESLHITVMGTLGKWVEIQIRSSRMDEIAEKGIAAHYKYKENYSVEESQIDQWVNQVREVLESENQSDAVEFMDNFKLNFYSKEIYVFTPKGDLKSLPKGATCLDFAYAIHTKVGDQCLGAKVNGRLLAINAILESGDQIEVITSANQKPKRDWLSFVVTSRARTRIKNALKSDKKLLAEDGREILIRKLRHLKIKFNEQVANEIMLYFNEKTTQDVFYKVATGLIGSQDIRELVEKRYRGIYKYGFVRGFRKMRRKTVKKMTESIASPSDIKDENTKVELVFGEEKKSLDYSLSSCCNPIPGEKVFGFLTVSKGLTVHKEVCPNAVDLRARFAYRVMPAVWVKSAKKEFRSLIRIKAIDRVSLISQITATISTNLGINIISINSFSDNGLFTGEFKVEIKNREQLNKMINRLKEIEGVSRVVKEGV